MSLSTKPAPAVSGQTPTDAIVIEQQLCETLARHVPVNDLPDAAMLVVKLIAAIKDESTPNVHLAAFDWRRYERESNSSSIPSARTVTRYHARDFIHSPNEVVMMASEVDPLLTALAATEHWQLMIDNDTLLTRLAEREQEIAELKAERDHLKKALTVSP